MALSMPTPKRQALVAMVGRILAETTRVFDDPRKRIFLADARKLAAHYVQLLSLPKGTYDLRTNPAGPAVWGEVTLHHERIYVQFGITGHGILFRTCAGRKDFTGGGNRWLPWDRAADDDAVRAYLLPLLAPPAAAVSA